MAASCFLAIEQTNLNNGIKTEIASAINLPFLKPSMHAHSVNKYIKKCLEENKEVKDKCVILYGFYPEVAENAFESCKQYKCKCFTMITDVPAMVLTNHKDLKGYFKAKSREHAVSMQGLADSYVYITRQMANVVPSGKPYHVIEGLVDTILLRRINGLP